MKRKLLLLVMLCMCFLVACGGKDNNSEPKQEVEKDIEITIPAAFFEEDITEEELATIKEENSFKEAILNEDGSVTYVMTESVHKKYLTDLKQSIKESCDEMVNESETIQAIEFNEDVTSFKITTSSENVTLQEGVLILGLYMYSGMYNIFNGIEVENVHVEFVNATSGEIIHSTDSKDLAEE